MLINMMVLENTLRENEDFVMRVRKLARNIMVSSMGNDNDGFGQKYSRSPESIIFHEQAVRNSEEYAVREIFRLNREFCYGKLLTAFVDRNNAEEKSQLLWDFEDAVIKYVDLIV